MAATEKTPRVSYRSSDDAKLTTGYAPNDFDSSYHKPLQKKDFESESNFWLYRAVEADSKARQYRAKAEALEAFGSEENRKLAKQLNSLEAKMASVKAKLVE